MLDTFGVLRGWMILAEACPGTFATMIGAFGKTTTTTLLVLQEILNFSWNGFLDNILFCVRHFFIEQWSALMISYEGEKLS